jgi:hypothetical protein
MLFRIQFDWFHRRAGMLREPANTEEEKMTA